MTDALRRRRIGQEFAPGPLLSFGCRTAIPCGVLTPQTMTTLRIAVPVDEAGAFCEHFGRCDGLLLCDVDPRSSTIDRPRIIRRPSAGKCEALPDWIKALGVNRILAGGIGAAAQHNLEHLGIDVVSGLSGTDPRQVVADHLAGTSTVKENPCATSDHKHHHCRG